jgi:hypothetical protein
MKEINARKIKNLRRKKSEGRPKSSERQKEIARIQLLVNNPMKNPEIAKKHGEKRKGKIYNNPALFKPGNKLGIKNKGKKHTDLQNTIHSMTMLGRATSEKQKDVARINLLINNPMKNPEIAKKQHLHPNVIAASKIKAQTILYKYRKQTKVPLTEKLLNEIVEEYNKGISLTIISKKIGLDRRTIKKIILSKNITIRPAHTYAVKFQKGGKHD